MLTNGSNFLERRESRKRRRLSERRRVFGRLAAASQQQAAELTDSEAARRSSLLALGEPVGGGEWPLVAAGDQGKISMRVQFHITMAPDNEPLLLEAQPLEETSQRQQQQQNSNAELASTSSTIGEHISERLSRQSSSTRRRQQLLAMHQRQQQASNRSEDNLAAPAGSPESPTISNRTGALLDANGTSNEKSRAGLRSSTITGGMQDEATLAFLARHQKQRLSSGVSGNLSSSCAGGSTSSLLSQHQTLMSASSNMRVRHEQREHIYFKRDGQRFGHEFTLKLAVDTSYRCLLKVRPLIPLEALSVQGQHVAFVDCSAPGAAASSFAGSSISSSGLGSSLSSSAPASSMALAEPNNTAYHHHQQTHILNSSPRHNSIAAPSSGQQRFLLHQNHNHHHQHHQHLQHNHSQNQHHHHRHLSHAQTTIGETNSAADPSGSSLSLQANNAARLQRQLLRQQQQRQMQRHFSSLGANASALASAHNTGQLVYMFDWSASRFEANRNKARTQLQTVLKFRNGQLLSLPLQVKFYQPECKQHLSWGSQLHFIDYDCNIDTMGQMSVDKIQYY